VRVFLCARHLLISIPIYFMELALVYISGVIEWDFTLYINSLLKKCASIFCYRSLFVREFQINLVLAILVVANLVSGRFVWRRFWCGRFDWKPITRGCHGPMMGNDEDEERGFSSNALNDISRWIDRHLYGIRVCIQTPQYVLNISSLTT